MDRNSRTTQITVPAYCSLARTAFMGPGESANRFPGMRLILIFTASRSQKITHPLYLELLH